MLRAIIISPDVELGDRLGDLIARAGRIGLVKSIDRYLVGHELERFLRANGPHVVFLSIENLSKAVEVVGGIMRMMPGVQVVAVDRTCDPSILLDLMHTGIREFLAYPFDGTSFMLTVERLEEILEKQPAVHDTTDVVISFLPAKAGAGTSTIALNAAVALSRLCEKQVLLADLDLNSGLLGFMMKLDNVHTVYDAAESSDELDEHLWPQLVARKGKLDVLAAGKLDPQARIEPVQLRKMVAFARRFYEVICLDLSGNMEKFSFEMMQESKRIFLVCTPEIPALHLARQKVQLLRQMDLGDRVSVLLNRAQKRSVITPAQIEQLLGAPVYMEFPNDYQGVHTALTEGREVDMATDLGKRFTKLSYNIMDKTPPMRPGAGRKKFLEFFSVPNYSTVEQK